ncbi:hypothetical protein EJ110_NYTH04755 [Nymphaea thermarum]|nr:hypothetical protein EJ110_NYTH04755 [Nymphaea thermarum]
MERRGIPRERFPFTEGRGALVCAVGYIHFSFSSPACLFQPLFVSSSTCLPALFLLDLLKGRKEMEKKEDPRWWDGGRREGRMGKGRNWKGKGKRASFGRADALVLHLDASLEDQKIIGKFFHLLLIFLKKQKQLPWLHIGLAAMRILMQEEEEIGTVVVATTIIHTTVVVHNNFGSYNGGRGNTRGRGYNGGRAMALNTGTTNSVASSSTYSPNVMDNNQEWYPDTALFFPFYFKLPSCIFLATLNAAGENGFRVGSSAKTMEKVTAAGSEKAIMEIFCKK